MGGFLLRVNSGVGHFGTQRRFCGESPQPLSVNETRGRFGEVIQMTIAGVERSELRAEKGS